MRLTQSGTFLHGNYWYNKGNPPFGRQGTSHGCVGLQDVQGGQGDTPSKWFYDSSILGDVVIVKNSPDKNGDAGQRAQRLEHVVERVGRGQRRVSH